jgi:hypothetical protein
MHQSGKPPEFSGGKIQLSGRWIDWLPQLANHFRPLRPLNETVSLGWYDLPLHGADKKDKKVCVALFITVL